MGYLKTKNGVLLPAMFEFPFEPEVESYVCIGEVEKLEIKEKFLKIEGNGIITRLELTNALYYFSEEIGNYFYDHSGNQNHISVGLNTRSHVTKKSSYEFDEND